jgi:TrmH family RNA methyltransferase
MMAMAPVPLRVVLVEPRHEGNVGSVARVMKNFGFRDLWLVRPRRLGPQAKTMAVHAGDLLGRARKVRSLGAALGGARLVVGTTSRDLPGTPARGPLVEPREMRRIAEGAGGLVVLLLGPEDHGLRVEELERCDVVVRIPTDRGYPSMNVSHAAAILLFELAGLAPEPVARATHAQVEGFLRHLDETLRDARFPAFRRKRTVESIRKMLGRANPAPAEVKVLRGALRKIGNALRIEREKSSSRSRRKR